MTTLDYTVYFCPNQKDMYVFKLKSVLFNMLLFYYVTVLLRLVFFSLQQNMKIIVKKNTTIMN